MFAVTLVAAAGPYFSPLQDEREVSLHVSEIIVTFNDAKKLGQGSILMKGSTSKVMRIPYPAQTCVFSIKGEGPNTYALDEHNISDVGANVEQSFEEHGSLSSSHVGLRNSKTLWIKPVRPLRPETVYRLDFPSDIVSPPEHIPPLHFTTKGYDPNSRPNVWTFQSDPWKFRPIDIASDYVELGSWSLCPVQQRSMSGCGDFGSDTRNVACGKQATLTSCDDHIFAKWYPELFSSMFKQRQVFAHHMPTEVYLAGLHIPFNLPIKLGSKMSELRAKDYSLPPTEIGHRDNWAMWGEYTYLPNERWVHNAEHGAAVFLFDSCVHDEDVCQIRDYVSQRPADGGGAFRWVISPYHSGQHERVESPLIHFTLFIVTYSFVLASHCFDASTANEFLSRHYREAYEDLPMGGYYDYLKKGKESRMCQSSVRGNWNPLTVTPFSLGAIPVLAVFSRWRYGRILM